jgi:hypothetical protein
MEDRMPARPFRALTIDLLAAEFVTARDGADEGRLLLLRDELAHRRTTETRNVVLYATGDHLVLHLGDPDEDAPAVSLQ